MFFNKKPEISEIDEKIINNIKALTIDINNIKSNTNLDISLSLAEVFYVLYSKHLKININDPNWINRDRVIICDKELTGLVEATSFMSGLINNFEDLKANKNINLKTILNLNPKYASGILNAIGVCISEKYLHDYFKENNLIDFYTYVFCNNLDLIKGISYECLNFIKNNKLKK